MLLDARRPRPGGDCRQHFRQVRLELIKRNGRSGVRDALGALRAVTIVLVVVSGVVNILAPIGPISVMQLYDRVLSSQSIATPACCRC